MGRGHGQFGIAVTLRVGANLHFEGEYSSHGVPLSRPENRAGEEHKTFALRIDRQATIGCPPDRCQKVPVGGKSLTMRLRETTPDIKGV